MSSESIPHHPVTTVDSRFDEIGLSEEILDSIRRVGFEHPTPIQASVIPVALQGGDVIALAETGSGKTAAFVIPLAEKLRHGEGLRALIVSPTREIALQTQAFVELFGKPHDLSAVCLIGGVKMEPQFKGLKKNPDVIVATPGRLLDHMSRGSVSLENVTEFVLDEADHMLDLGFMPQIRKIVRQLPRPLRTMMFSATMPDPIERLAREMMNDPARIDILPLGKTASGISHRLYLVSMDDRRECLMALLHQELGSTLVFVRTKVDAEWIHAVLSKEGHPVARIHSDRSQGRRTQALDRFRKGSHRILVATDIAGRGIDVPGITHVINYDLPETVEDYIHRAGRTARGDREGIVSSIATFKDLKTIERIEAELGSPIPRCSVPGVREFVEAPRRPRSRSRP